MEGIPNTQAKAPKSGVILFGPVPPPIGGVTRSVESIANQLSRADVKVQLVGYRDAIHALRVWIACRKTPPRLIAYNVSGPRSFYGALAVSQIFRSEVRVLFIHGTQTVSHLIDQQRKNWIDYLTKRLLRKYHQVWVNNSEISRALVQWLPSLRTLVVSPVAQFADQNRTPREGQVHFRLIVAVYRGLPLYGLEFAIDALQHLLDLEIPCTLDVLMYGGSTIQTQELVEKFSQQQGVTWHFELAADDVQDLLTQTDIVLRPTSSDGDSLLVREALSAGCRVLATPVVPRPRGCELVEQSGQAIATAVLNGGAPSTGSGLGVSAVDAISSWL